MASVKASENQATVLATLPSTLLFDTFKSSRDDEKDSDEESFHLPMLDCDEDLQLDKSNSQPTESEDDILDKFESGTSEVPTTDSNIESVEETPEHHNSTNGCEDTEETNDTVVNDEGENVCEYDGNNAEVMEETLQDVKDDAAIESNIEPENEVPIEQIEDLNNGIPTENSDLENDGMSVVDNETLNNEIPVGDDQQLDEQTSVENGELLNNDEGGLPVEDNENSFNKITTEGVEPLNTETLTEDSEHLDDEIATGEDNIGMGDEVENENGDDKINDVVPGENEELSETDGNQFLDNNIAIERNETTNENTVTGGNNEPPNNVDKLEEEEQLESLLSQGESLSQAHMNETSNLDDEEASLNDLVDNINAKMDDDDDDELQMNDDLMNGMSGENISEGVQDDFNSLRDTNDIEASIGVEVQGTTEEKNDELNKDSEGIENVAEEMGEGDNLDNDLEPMETGESNEIVEDESEKVEGDEKLCTMNEDTEEAMLVDDDEPEDAEKVLQNELIEDHLTDNASEIGQGTESCEALVEDEVVKDTENIPQTELSEDPEIDQEPESCKALSKDEIVKHDEEINQIELHQDPLTEKAPDIGQETESGEAMGEDGVVKDAEEITETELSSDRLTEKAPEIEQESESCEALGKEAEETHQTELPHEPLAEKFTESEQEMEMCKALDEEKHSTEVNKTEDSSKEPDEASKSDTIDEIKETAQAPCPEDEPSKKESVAISEDDKNEPETKEEDSSDNLLDISVIRDVDEDNATAIAEQAAESQSSEKSDNDELDQEDDKTDEVEDSELDQEADKDENMDFDEEDEEDTTNVCDSVIEDTCDSDALKIDAGEESLDNKERAETPLSEEDIPLSQRLSAKPSEERESQAGSDAEADVDSTLTPETDKVDDVQPKLAPVTPTSSVPDTVTSVTEGKIKDVAAQKKRSLSPVPENETPSKKIRLSVENDSYKEEKPQAVEPDETQPSEKKTKVLLSFQKYMQNKTIKDKLSRSDLEQLCIQKICEAIIHKTDVGELHQTVKKQELLIENLRKDIQTLTKQARDLDIVNKKLMNELKTQYNGKKPVVPLKITRSVGLQVKLSQGAEPTRRKSTSTASTSSTPTKAASSPVVNRTRNVQANSAGSSVLRAIVPAPSPVRTSAPQTTPILTKALTTSQQTTQKSPLVTHSSPASPMKGRSVRKSPSMVDQPKVPNSNSVLKQTPNKASPVKPSQPGVIDLTDEDDRVAARKTGGPVKTLRGVPIVTPAPQSKANGVQTKGAVQSKNLVKVGQQGTPPGSRTVAGLPQGVRLTTNQVKNGIAIPVSTGSTTQLMYVVQPSSTANSNQKTLTLLNLPTQQLITSAMNGSTVSMISSKSAGTVQVKQLATRKHPAPLPLPPITPVNSAFKPVLPKPHLSIRKTDNGIILQWRMPYNLDLFENIASYQLFAYQETNAPPSTEMWRKVGDVKALALPMACTLTQFADKNKYYFAVRSVDVHKRIGAFSDPEEISL